MSQIRPSDQSVNSQARINAAIRDCLATLQPGRSAIDHLANYLICLRQDPIWSEDEIKDVETGVRHILTGLVEGIESGEG
jgi:hypothetical protein